MKRRKFLSWICIGFVSLSSIMLGFPRTAKASIFGEENIVLGQILIQTIQQVHALTSILGKARDTVSILEEMNRGVKEVLRLSETAHVPIPKSIYEKAKQIDDATTEARRIYGGVGEKSPISTRTQFKSGVEGLFMSQDAFEYSNLIDHQGSRVKSSAITASQSAATRLTAESMGVLLHAVSHSNRIQAKELEISSSTRLEESAKESARFDSFTEAHTGVENELEKSFLRLPSLDNGGAN